MSTDLLSLSRIDDHADVQRLLAARRELVERHASAYARIEELKAEKARKVQAQPTYRDHMGNELLLGVEELNFELAALSSQTSRLSQDLQANSDALMQARNRLSAALYAEQHAAIVGALGTLREMAVLFGEQVEAARRVLNAYNTAHPAGQSRWPWLPGDPALLAMALTGLLGRS